MLTHNSFAVLQTTRCCCCCCCSFGSCCCVLALCHTRPHHLLDEVRNAVLSLLHLIIQLLCCPLVAVLVLHSYILDFINHLLQLTPPLPLTPPPGRALLLLHLPGLTTVVALGVAGPQCWHSAEGAEGWQGLADTLGTCCCCCCL
ncbi:hypothetical protein COO60DRAFT_1561293 [Scenedesmus sp. NREL 46B-D3]|nr:hypothetical protein COO60DRAFT_1561293 [Scenedesmus sp. NREL 46B-D3]